MSTQNVNVARFARNVEWYFFYDFQTPCVSAATTTIATKTWIPDADFVQPKVIIIHRFFKWLMHQNASLRSSSITFPPSRFRLFIRCGAKVRCRSSRHFGLLPCPSYLLVSIQLLSEKAKQKIWSYDDAQICLGKLNHLDATNDVH